MTVHTSHDASPCAKLELKAGEGWHECTSDLKVPEGVHALYFIIRSDASVDFRSFEIR